MATIKVSTLKSYMNAGLNIIISGAHGTGKTAMLQEASKQLGFKMQYYSASTMDPFTDLTGIPVPNTESKTVEYYRPHAIDDAEIIFFDELNRADPKTLNTLMEIILNKSINGEPLTKLKAVVAAINPVTDDYTTDELDKALLDRFDVFLQSDPAIDLGYFTNKFGDQVGAAAVTWWKEYNQSVERAKGTRNVVPYISPRRVDMMVSAYVAIPALQTIADTMPPEISDFSITRQLATDLKNALAPASTTATQNVENQVRKITMQPISVQRNRVTAVEATKLVQSGVLSADLQNALFTSLAVALNSGKGPEVLATQFGVVIKAMNATQYSVLTNGWSKGKAQGLKDALAAL